MLTYGAIDIPAALSAKTSEFRSLKALVIFIGFLGTQREANVIAFGQTFGAIDIPNPPRIRDFA